MVHERIEIELHGVTVIIYVVAYNITFTVSDEHLASMINLSVDCLWQAWSRHRW